MDKQKAQQFKRPTNRQQVINALNVFLIVSICVGLLATIGERLLAATIQDGNAFIYLAVVFAAPFVLLVGGLAAEASALIGSYSLFRRTLYVAGGVVMAFAAAWLYLSTYGGQ